MVFIVGLTSLSLFLRRSWPLCDMRVANPIQLRSRATMNKSTSNWRTTLESPDAQPSRSQSRLIEMRFNVNKTTI